jgi:hypothetical protein
MTKELCDGITVFASLSEAMDFAGDDDWIISKDGQWQVLAPYSKRAEELTDKYAKTFGKPRWIRSQ